MVRASPSFFPVLLVSRFVEPDCIVHVVRMKLFYEAVAARPTTGAATNSLNVCF